MQPGPDQRRLKYKCIEFVFQSCQGYKFIDTEIGSEKHKYCHARNKQCFSNNIKVDDLVQYGLFDPVLDLQSRTPILLINPFAVLVFVCPCFCSIEPYQSPAWI